MDASTTPYLPFLERVLTPSRLQHSLGVMQVMNELTPIYGMDPGKALLAGLLHDAAKDLPLEDRERIIREAGFPTDAPWDRDYVNYMHGPVGAYFVQKELGIQDPQILDAITMHTFCGEGEAMETPLSWCLRFADILEPNRNWYGKARLLHDETPRLRQLVYSGQLDEAALLQTHLLIQVYEGIPVAIHPNLSKIYQERSKQSGARA